MAEPRCSLFSRCGGCSFQDQDYGRQLDHKKQVLEAAIDFNDIQVFSGREYGYRNRMDFVFHAQGLGFRVKGSWSEMVDVPVCPISGEKLNALLSEIRDYFKGVFYFDVRRRFGTYCFAVIRTSSKGSSVSIVLNKKSKKLDDALQKIQQYAGMTTADSVLATFIPHNRNVSVSDDYQVIKGSDFLEEDYLGHTFSFPVQGFFQVNSEIAEMVHCYCREIISGYQTGEADLLDLYGGVGTFGLLNSPYFRRVTVVENYPAAIQAFHRNRERNGVENARIISLDARFLKTLEFPRPLYIILDPPRSGMHPKTLAYLNQIDAEALIYISCNPKHLGNDLKELTRYRIHKAALFDMFPQTPHMETVVELRPR